MGPTPGTTGQPLPHRWYDANQHWQPLNPPPALPPSNSSGTEQRINLVRLVLACFAFTALGLAYVIPRAAEWRHEYLPLGSLWGPGLQLGAIFGLLLAAWFLLVGGWRLTRNFGVVALPALVLGALVVGLMWAPWVNANLGAGPSITAEGTVEELGLGERTRSTNRRLTFVVDGVQREVDFSAHECYWHVIGARSGGPVVVTIRPGYFGVPWIADMRDPTPHPGVLIPREKCGDLVGA